MVFTGERPVVKEPLPDVSCNPDHHLSSERLLCQSSSNLCEESNMNTDKNEESCCKDSSANINPSSASQTSEVTSLESNMDASSPLNIEETVSHNSENIVKPCVNTIDLITKDKIITNNFELAIMQLPNNSTSLTSCIQLSEHDTSTSPDEMDIAVSSQSSVPSPSILQNSNVSKSETSTSNIEVIQNDGIPEKHNCSSEITQNPTAIPSQVPLPIILCEASTSLQSNLTVINNLDTINTTSVSAPNTLATPPTLKTLNSCSPSQALSSIVEYGVSSDSEDDSTDSEAEHTNLVPPVSGDRMEIQMDTVGDEDVVVICPPTTAVDEPPVIDLVASDYREIVNIQSGTDDSESDSESSSASSISSLSEDETSDSENWSSKVIKKEPQDTKNKSEKKAPTKKKSYSMLTKGELSLDDLPPIEDLKISVPETLAHVIGYVHSIVEQQVVVQGHRGVPPIDLDSILFLDNGKRALGQIFDVFGKVQEPLYVVRFNSADHVKENKINKGDPVFYAPSTEHTSFVVIDELMRIKGSDASGLTGNEILPSEMTDFSDDEEEARLKGRFSRQNKYESSTKEFQSKRKRSCNQGRGNENRGRGTDHPHSGNPFSERGMCSRPPNRYGQSGSMRPKFDPRYTPGPSRPRGGMTGQMANSYTTENREFASRSFSPYGNQEDMNYNSGQYTLSNSPWPQPHQSQFGGPPQFSTTIPPPTYQARTFPTYSPGAQNTALPVSPFPPSFSHRPPPPQQTESFQNMRPPPSPYPPASTPQLYPPSNGFQNMMIPQTPPPPPCSPSFSPRPPHFTNGFQSMGPTAVAINHSQPATVGSVNGAWCPPGHVAPSPPPSTFSQQVPPPMHIPSSELPHTYAQSPLSHLQSPPPPMHFQTPPPAELFHPPPPPSHAYPPVNPSVPPPQSSSYNYNYRL